MPANLPRFRVSALNYRSWAERAAGLEALAVFFAVGATLTDRGDPESLPGGAVTASMFRVLGLTPIAGRALQAEDERVGAARVAVLGESLWRRRFGGDRAIVGQLITINGERSRSVGVVPAAFRDIGRSIVTSTAAPQLFVPFTIDPARENRGNHTIRVVGRLRAGVSIGQAQDEMQRIAAALEQEFPATNKGWGVHIDRISNTMFDQRVRPSLLALLAAVALVLLIACANVASVFLARNLSRQRELALRSALGARRSRLIRQLMTEGACFAVVSGAAGLLLAALAVRALKVMLPPTLPRIDEIVVDAPVLAAGLLASIASGLVVGLIPAWRASRAVLMSDARPAGQGYCRVVPDVRAPRSCRGADGARDDAAGGGGAAVAKFRAAAAGASRIRTRSRHHCQDWPAEDVLSGCRPHTRLLAAAAGIAGRPGRRAERRDRHQRAVHARRARGRTGARSTDRLGVAGRVGWRDRARRERGLLPHARYSVVGRPGFRCGGLTRIAARGHRLGERRARAVAGRQSDRPDDRVERCAPGGR